MTDTWLTVWEVDGDVFSAAVSEEPRIDAAVSAYIESAGSRDSMIRLTLMDGRELTTLASRLTSWAVSTPETRRLAMEYQKWQDAETKTFRQELGIWEDA